MKSLKNLNFKMNRKNTVEALVSRHPRGGGGVKQVSITGADAYLNVKTQSLFGSLGKRGFVIAAVIRAVRLRESPLGELPL